MEIKKYRLGNQPEEYELREDYLGWIPKNYDDWWFLSYQRIKNKKLTIINPKDQAEKGLFLHHCIIKDAFPMSFYREERADEWNHFAIVSETETSEKFIIPINIL